MKKILLPFLSSLIFLTSAFALEDPYPLKQPNEQPTLERQSLGKAPELEKNLHRKKGRQFIEISTLVYIPVKIGYGYRQFNKSHGWDVVISHCPWGIIGYYTTLVEFSYLPNWKSKDKDTITYLGIGGGGGIAQVVFDSGRKTWMPVPSLFLKGGIQTNVKSDKSPYYGIKIGFPNFLSFEAGLGF